VTVYNQALTDLSVNDLGLNKLTMISGF